VCGCALDDEVHLTRLAAEEEGPALVKLPTALDHRIGIGWPMRAAVLAHMHRHPIAATWGRSDLASSEMMSLEPVNAGVDRTHRTTWTERINMRGVFRFPSRNTRRSCCR
jgi:hypothetical protein